MEASVTMRRPNVKLVMILLLRLREGMRTVVTAAEIVAVAVLVTVVVAVIRWMEEVLHRPDAD